jgi:hypothetical protein
MNTTDKHGEWERKIARRMDTASMAAWRHPGDAIDRATQRPGRTEVDLIEATVRLYQDLLPASAQCGGARRYLSGYYRLCAWVYRVSPAIYEGQTGEQVARTLGISYTAWKKHLVHVDRRLARHLP